MNEPFWFSVACRVYAFTRLRLALEDVRRRGDFICPNWMVSVGSWTGGDGKNVQIAVVHKPVGVVRGEQEL
jgi:hypothetical protein